MAYNNVNVSVPAPTSNTSALQDNSRLNTSHQCCYNPANMSTNLNGSFVDANIPLQFKGNQSFCSAGTYKPMGSYVVNQVRTNQDVI